MRSSKERKKERRRRGGSRGRHLPIYNFHLLFLQFFICQHVNTSFDRVNSFRTTFHGTGTSCKLSASTVDEMNKRSVV
jgi:hypothetical protein